MLNVPTTLDDIITTNREILSIGLAAPDEIAALVGEVVGQPRDTLDDWRLIAFRQRGNASQLSLLGTSRRLRHAWITTDIRCIELGEKVRTKNSVYELGLAGQGEPPQEHLLLVCASAHAWGFGDKFGIMKVYY